MRPRAPVCLGTVRKSHDEGRERRHQIQAQQRTQPRQRVAHRCRQHITATLARRAVGYVRSHRGQPPTSRRTLAGTADAGPVMAGATRLRPLRESIALPFAPRKKLRKAWAPLLLGAPLRIVTV